MNKDIDDVITFVPDNKVGQSRVRWPSYWQVAGCKALVELRHILYFYRSYSTIVTTDT